MIKLIHPLLHVYKVFESRKLKFVCLIKQKKKFVFVKTKELSKVFNTNRKNKIKIKKVTNASYNHVVNQCKTERKIVRMKNIFHFNIIHTIICTL